MEHPLEFTLPVKTKSPNQYRGRKNAWATRRDAKAERRLAHSCMIEGIGAWNYKSPDAWEPYFPCQILMTRVSAGKLDDDNLRGALKSIRDGIADCLGRDDKDPTIRWLYAQAHAKRGVSEVRVIIEPMGIVARCPHCGGMITTADVAVDPGQDPALDGEASPSDGTSPPTSGG